MTLQVTGVGGHYKKMLFTVGGMPRGEKINILSTDNIKEREKKTEINNQIEEINGILIREKEKLISLMEELIREFKDQPVEQNKPNQQEVENPIETQNQEEQKGEE